MLSPVVQTQIKTSRPDGRIDLFPAELAIKMIRIEQLDFETDIAQIANTSKADKASEKAQTRDI
jgi:hypothetical protein